MPQSYQELTIARYFADTAKMARGPIPIMGRWGREQAEGVVLSGSAHDRILSLFTCCDTTPEAPQTYAC